MEQQIQGETELLFIKLAQMREQEQLAKQILRLSEAFYDLMAKRDSYGRAEQLDVAEAKSQVVLAGGRLLQIELTAKSLEKRLSHRVYQKVRPEIIRFETFPLSRPVIPLPAAAPKKLIEYALGHRKDLSMLSALKKPWYAQLDLAKEQNSMSVNLFASASVNGLGESAQDATSEMRHPNYTAGININIPIGKRSFRAEKEAATAALNEIEHKYLARKQSITRDLELAWLDLTAADKLYSQAKYHEESVNALLKEERKRIRQARSDEIAAIRYQINTLNARLDATTALAKAREAEAQIRLICHAYDSESAHEKTN